MGVSRDCPMFLGTPIISGTGKATDFKLGQYIQSTVHPNKSPLKFLEKRERGRIQGLPNFFRYPRIISGTGKATDFQFGQYIQGVHPNKSPLKFLEKRERVRIQGLPNFFRVPPIISGTGKATKFKFCTHILHAHCDIYKLNRNKSPLKISTKIAVGIVRDSRNFSGHPYIGRIARSSSR